MLDSDDDMRILAKTDWFGTRDSKFQSDLMTCAIQRTFDSGETLYHHGDRANGIHAVLAGALQITAPADDGQEFVLHQDGSGFWIGDLALFAEAKRLVSVVATQKTRTLYFPGSRVERLVQKNPEYIRDFYALTHENMKTALRIMANLAVTGSEKRLVLRLLHLDEGALSSDGWIVVSQEELAEMVAVSQPTLHRHLHHLADLGLVELGYGRLRLIDRRKLISNCQS
ncbi:cyclic nucleotide-binding domain-containing protein [Ruegeria sp. HKCCD6228]|uniref:Crp/Fnr family transcriptional regulator n=1 Tax=unclassified Ruegeria TaxID=2625375 RepID=UPI00148773DD|nr:MULTISPECIES: Crp/Fnr family transcriptional regulator [unclassified Ruegeria]NOD96059.1 cyclic nucleotide-binding domain-containing protein [Ruegeria sp. HKCCD6228]